MSNFKIENEEEVNFDFRCYNSTCVDGKIQITIGNSQLFCENDNQVLDDPPSGYEGTLTCPKSIE